MDGAAFGGQTARGHPKAGPRPRPQAASLCSAGIERTRKMLAGWAFCEMLSQYAQSAFRGFPGGPQRGSAAVCDPNPPRPFARYRKKITKVLGVSCSLRPRSLRRSFGTFSRLFPDSPDFSRLCPDSPGGPGPEAPGAFWRPCLGFRAQRARETPVNGQWVNKNNWSFFVIISARIV